MLLKLCLTWKLKHDDKLKVDPQPCVAGDRIEERGSKAPVSEFVGHVCMLRGLPKPGVPPLEPDDIEMPVGPSGSSSVVPPVGPDPEEIEYSPDEEEELVPAEESQDEEVPGEVAICIGGETLALHRSRGHQPYEAGCL